jgi:hypothetical protein
MYPEHKRVLYIVPLFDVNAWSGFTNQPDGDGVEIVSNNASDTGLITIFGTNKTTGALEYETITLTGTDAVSTVETDWDDIKGAFLGNIYGQSITPAVGTITLREASTDGAITTIAATKISKGMPGFIMPGLNVRIIDVSGNLYFKNGAAATTTNSYPFAAAEKLDVKQDDVFYLISDTNATAKILVYAD